MTQFFRSVFLALCIVILPGVLLAQKVALVIGNASYLNNADLDNPVNDATKISIALQIQGFDVTKAIDLNRADTFDALRSFRAKADASTVALVYYAGHGIEIGGVNYLVPVDAELLDERDASVELIAVDMILEQISGASQLKMVVLDACRNNPFVAEMKRKKSSRGIVRGLGKIEVSDADTLIAYAAAAGEITPDGISGGNSPFTLAFLKALSGPPKDVRLLLGSVRDEMRLTVPGAEPFVYANLGGGEYVINSQSPPANGGPQSAQPSAGQTTNQAASQNEFAMFSDFLVAGELAKLEVWDAFLMKYRDHQPSGVYQLAIQKRAEIAKVGPGKITDLSRSQNPNTPPFYAPETKRDAVRMLQTYLRDRGCFRNQLDGFYGPRTARGLASYSTKSGVSYKLAAKPGLEELTATLRQIMPDTETKCQLPRATVRVKVKRKRSTKPKRKTAAAPATNTAPARTQTKECVVFEGESFCN